MLTNSYVNIDGKYFLTNENIEISQKYTSYTSYNLELSLSDLELSYLKNINKDKINNNILIASIFDDKLYYNTNTIDKSSYQYNSLLFVNNEKNIIPLTLNIKNINSALTIDNNEIQFKIDNNTIIENSYKLAVDHSTLSLSGYKPGLFKPDEESLIIDNNNITLSYNIKDIIDNIDEHIVIMNNVITQCTYNLEDVMGIFKEYSLYDKKYSCNTNVKYPIYYSDEKINNVKIDYITNSEIGNHHKYYIDYYRKYFKLKVKFVYNYQSANLSNFNPFNENNINIKINDVIYDENTNFNIKNFIKYNKNKSYVYNNGINYFDEKTNNVYGEVNYILYFDIDTDSLYNSLNSFINTNNIIVNKSDISIEIIYNDKSINSESNTIIYFELFIDSYKNNKIHKILYHNYDSGFNFDGIGNIVGICLLDDNCIKFSQNINKPIFLKYFTNENNYIINNVSSNIIEKYPQILSNNKISITNNIRLNFISDLQNYYRNIDILKDLDTNILSTITNTHNQYKNILKYCFNSTYNIKGNGLRKGDCYIPSIYELFIFYLLGFHYYISYIESDLNTFNLYSSTFYKDQSNNINTIGINYNQFISHPNNTDITIDQILPLIQINNDGSLVYTPTENNFNHISVSLFKLPDISILKGQKYYLAYEEKENCEIVDYITKKDMTIRIKCYNNVINSPRDVISKIHTHCINDNIKISINSVTKVDDNIYDILFDTNEYNNKNNYYDIDIYYKDLDDSFNTFIVDNLIYRRICRISLKID